ncbi:MAG: hypothetical protein OXB84_08950 [Halobacteriovoraceae bacterium]|nr:hypothetical protein [Halobacteriovoraceae bacterium]
MTLNIGPIFFNPNFIFRDGQRGKKLLVIISNPLKNKCILICKTTSKERHPFRIKEKGCRADYDNFMIPSNEDWFNQDTWLQFDDIYEVEIEGFSNKDWLKKARLKYENIIALLKFE